MATLDKSPAYFNGDTFAPQKSLLPHYYDTIEEAREMDRLAATLRDDGIVNSSIAEMNRGNPKLSAEEACARRRRY